VWKNSLFPEVRLGKNDGMSSGYKGWDLISTDTLLCLKTFKALLTLAAPRATVD